MKKANFYKVKDGKAQRLKKKDKDKKNIQN